MTKNIYKRGVDQRYGKPQKKESNRNPGNKRPFFSFIHMCIHCLGHFSPHLPLPPSSPPTPLLAAL
jgi:hypothetical protein